MSTDLTERQRLINWARGLADPDWCLSVPKPAKQAMTQLLATLEAVSALHQPVKRWMPYEGAGVSYDTEQDAIEATEDCDLNSVAMQELAENGMPYFEVCGHCQDIEDSPCEGECTLEAGYRESLWPCPTVRAIASAL
jgi:hypothetical protein